MSPTLARIYEDVYPVFVLPAESELIRVKPTFEHEDLIDGGYLLDGSYFFEERPNEAAITSLIMGTRRSSGIDRIDTYLTTMLEERGATINDIIEIYDISRKVRFVKFMDLVNVYNNLNTYLTEIENRIKFSVNRRFNMPEEDLRKMRQFHKAIMRKAQWLGAKYQINDPNDPWGKLMAMFTNRPPTENELVIEEVDPEFNEAYAKSGGADDTSPFDLLYRG